MNTCFYAYPFQPQIISTIRDAIRQINNSQDKVRIKSWEELRITGNYIVNEVCSAIDEADVFLCDLTFLNPNVLFELGYAIAQNKRVWISIDTSLHDSDRYNKDLLPLTTIGYAIQRNVDELRETFLAEEPYLDLENTIYNKTIKSLSESPRKDPSILYLKSSVPTEASRQITRYLETTNIPIITDDIEEASNRTLSWYIENVFRCYGIVAHFLDDLREAKYPQNAKYAFVCGMGYANAKKIKMLVEAPHTSPLDYRDLLSTYSDATQCKKFVERWIAETSPVYERRKEIHRRLQRKLDGNRALQRIILGEYEAENEEDELVNYFYPTPAYEDALNTSQYMIFVGRKGSGKTANFYRMYSELQKSNNGNNHICVIKPIDYEIEGIYNIFSMNVMNSEKMHIVENLWKFLIYTELALEIYGRMKQHPVHYVFSDDEKEFQEFIDDNSDIIKMEFTVRMEQSIKKLTKLDTSGDIEKNRERISYILHDQILNRLRYLLGKILKEDAKVFVLVDNLDKAWQPRSDLDVLSSFLFGLLAVTHSIASDFHRKDSKITRLDLALVVFIRSDIFSYIMPRARERDKLKYTYIDWNNKELLFKVIEERFIYSMSETILPEEVWQKYFVPEIEDKPTKEYLLEQIIPRPRDIIFLCRQALSNAKSHGHEIIEESDITQAEMAYSSYAYSALLAEIEAKYPGIEELIIEFAGNNEVISISEIETMFLKLNHDISNLETVIDLLCDATFLGLEISPDHFEFLYNETRKKIMHSLARKVVETNGERRFKINRPYHRYLDINLYR